MNSLEALLERYVYSGIDPLADWTTEDLAELETLVNAELQERARMTPEHSERDTHVRYVPGCPCTQCVAIDQGEGR